MEAEWPSTAWDLRRLLCSAPSSLKFDVSSDLPGQSDLIVHIPLERSFDEYYTIVSPLGSGTFGAVYTCTPKRKFETVVKRSNTWWCSSETSTTTAATLAATHELAVKIINKPKDSTGEGLMDKFGSTLLKAALGAEHPNTVRYRQFLEDTHKMYVIMDRYTGPDLFDYIISNRPMSEKLASKTIAHVLRAILFIHEVGGMHRDIKPENFMFEHSNVDEANLKLVDFGSAIGRDPARPRELNPLQNDASDTVSPPLDPVEVSLNPSRESSAPRSNAPNESVKEATNSTFDAGQSDEEGTKGPRERVLSVVGTTGYCAPEVFTGRYDEGCDTFSAGVILFVCLTGEMPFECRDVNQYKNALRRAQRDGLGKTLCHFRGDRCRRMSPEAKDIVFKLLAVTPSERLKAREALQHLWILKYQEPVDQMKHASMASQSTVDVPVVNCSSSPDQSSETIRRPTFGKGAHWFQDKVLAPLLDR